MSFLSKIGATVQWFSVQANRKKVYKAAKFLIPAAVAAGVLSDGTAADIFYALSVVLGFAAPHLADKHS